MLKFILSFSILFIFASLAKGQYVLEKKISVHYKSKNTEAILMDLENRLGVSFSYPSNLFSTQQKFTFHFYQKETQEVLHYIFNPSMITFEEKGHYIILRRKPLPVKIHHMYKFTAALSDDSTQKKLTLDTLENKSIHSPSLKKDTLQHTSYITPTDLPTVVIKNTDSINLSKTTVPIQTEKPSYKYHTRHFVLMHYAKGNYQHTQTSLLLNKGKKVSGSQIGLINIAQSVSGTQIGLINICKNGYHKFELWSSSSLQANAAFKTGTSKLYTIIAAGLSADKEFEDYDWGLGYGMGKEFILGKKILFNVDAILYQLGSDLKAFPTKWNLVQQFRLNTSYKVNKYIILFAGPEINIRITNSSPWSSDKDGDSDDQHLHRAPNNSSSKSARIWLGINGGIRF